MADTDNFEFQQENDFEKISAPGTGSDQEGDGLQPTADKQLDSSKKAQDGEVSTTTDNNSGEDVAEEDQFNIIGASEVEGSSFSQNPLISLDAHAQSGQPDPTSQFHSDSPDLVDLGLEVEDNKPVAEADLVNLAENSNVDLSRDEPKLVSAADSPPQLLDLISEAVDQPSAASEQVPHLDLVTEAESKLVDDHFGIDPEKKPENLAEARLVNDHGDHLDLGHSAEADTQPTPTAPPNLAESDLDLLETATTLQNEGPGDEENVVQTNVPSTILEPSAPAPEDEGESHDYSEIESNDYEPVEFDSSSGTGLTSTSVTSSVETEAAPCIVSEVVPSESESGLEVNSEIKDVPTISEQSRDLAEGIDQAEEIDQGCWLKGVDPREPVKEDEEGYFPILVELIYWRDVKKTGIVFGTMLTVLLCLAIFSLVSVLAYLSLALLTVSFSFVVYKKIMAAVQKSNDGHPFKYLLEMDIGLKEDKLKPVINALLNNLNTTVSELRRLFFIEDIVDSIKFGLMLWVSTYLGSLLNGMTLIILAVILLFSAPKVYETYQVQIDNHVGLVKAQFNSIVTTVQMKLPFLKKKEKAQ